MELERVQNEALFIEVCDDILLRISLWEQEVAFINWMQDTIYIQGPIKVMR